MPVIKIREKTEELRRTVTGQSNAAVIPLFVSGIYIKSVEDDKNIYARKEFVCQLYHTRSAFEEDYSNFVIRDAMNGILDNSYYMIGDLLDEGLEIYVDPIDLTNPDTLPGPLPIEFPTFTVIVDDPDNPGEQKTVTVEIKGNTLNPIFEDLIDFSNYNFDNIPNPVLVSILKEYIRTGYDYIEDPTQISTNMEINLEPELKDQIDEKTFTLVLDELISAPNYKDGLTNSYYYKFRDKTRFNFKFLTTGAHANAYFGDLLDETTGASLGLNTSNILGPFKTMLALSASFDELDKYSGRGDCITLIDFEHWLRKDSTPATIYDAMTCDNYNDIDYNYGNDYYKFASCTYPWIIRKINNNLHEFPGSYAYLRAFAKSINKDNPDYYSIAGYNRGEVGTDSDYTPVERLGENDVHLFQSDSFALYPIKEDESQINSFNITINPIIRFQESNKGVYRIWGNRIMCEPPLDEDERPNSDVTQDVNYFLNVRQLVCDIKKQCYFASTRVSFEPNDDITWFNYKTFVNPMLESMVSNRGLDWYTWNREESDIKGQMKAKLTIKPIEAVESFDITVYIRNTDEE